MVDGDVPAGQAGRDRLEAREPDDRPAVRIYRLTRGRLLGHFDDAPLLILHSTGARTGKLRQTPMIFLRDGERVVMVASMGGNPRNPAWYHNVKAHPDVVVEDFAERRSMRARVASEEEAAALWPRLFEMWPSWHVYMSRTTRTFPVVICEPRR